MKMNQIQINNMINSTISDKQYGHPWMEGEKELVKTARVV